MEALIVFQGEKPIKGPTRTLAIELESETSSGLTRFRTSIREHFEGKKDMQTLKEDLFIIINQTIECLQRLFDMANGKIPATYFKPISFRTFGIPLTEEDYEVSEEPYNFDIYTKDLNKVQKLIRMLIVLREILNVDEKSLLTLQETFNEVQKYSNILFRRPKYQSCIADFKRAQTSRDIASLDQALDAHDPEKLLKDNSALLFKIVSYLGTQNSPITGDIANTDLVRLVRCFSLVHRPEVTKDMLDFYKNKTTDRSRNRQMLIQKVNNWFELRRPN